MTLRAFITFIIDIAAVYRLTKLVIDDEIAADLREKLWEHFPPETTKLGYLITCPWCTSIWMGAAIFALRKISPEMADYTSAVLASSAATGIAFSKGL